MSKITEKLNQRKIVLIALLNSKGITDNRIISQVLKGNKRSLNLIYAKHIKHTRINDKQFFIRLIKPKDFSKDFVLVQKIDIICTEINKILLKRYSNNKSNVIFQEFIDFLLDYLLGFNNTHLSFDLYTHIKQNYKIHKKVNPIHETIKAGKYTLEQLKIVGELIDHIDYINYFNNDITKLQRLRMRKSYNLDLYFINYTNNVLKFVSKNKDLKEIYDALIFDEGKIENKLLYNELVKLKEKLHETLHQINYGTNISDKASSRVKANISNELSTAILPFSESGKLQLSDKQFNNLHINTIFCNKLNDKFIKALKNGRYNNKSIDGQITIINEGENTCNKGKFNKSYFIRYQYKATIKQQNAFKRLMKNLEISCKDNNKLKPIDNNPEFNERNYIKPCYNKRQRTTDFNEFIRCSYIFPYINKSDNYKAFKQHFKDNVKSKLNIRYNHLYPYAVKQSPRQKKKFLSFVSWDHNTWKDYSLRTKINNDLSNIIYNIDLNRLITKFYNPKNQINYTKPKQRLFLKDLIRKIQKTHLKRFNAYLETLIKDYNNRIYLFETYGIKALVNQITDMKNYYNLRFLNKRIKDARLLKKDIKTLELLIPIRKQYLEVLIMQKLMIENNLVKLNPSSILMQSILHDNIENYLRKSIIRKIDTSRSPKELVLMACNNLKPLYIDYMNSMPIYVKENIDDYSKFEELLGTSTTTKIEYIDQWSTVNVIDLFKAIVQFDRFFDLSDLYSVILNSNVKETILDNEVITHKLKEFIFKEKHILNT